MSFASSFEEFFGVAPDFWNAETRPTDLKGSKTQQAVVYRHVRSIVLHAKLASNKGTSDRLRRIKKTRSSRPETLLWDGSFRYHSVCSRTKPSAHAAK